MSVFAASSRAADKLGSHRRNSSNYIPLALAAQTITMRVPSGPACHPQQTLSCGTLPRLCAQHWSAGRQPDAYRKPNSSAHKTHAPAPQVTSCSCGTWPAPGAPPQTPHRCRTPCPHGTPAARPRACMSPWGAHVPHEMELSAPMTQRQHENRPPRQPCFHDTPSSNVPKPSRLQGCTRDPM